MDITHRNPPDETDSRLQPPPDLSERVDSQCSNVCSTGQYGFEAEQSIPDRFRQVISTFPKSQALIAGEWQPDYEQLDNVSNRIAREILSRGGERGDRIAIFTRHDSPQMAAVMGVLKANRVVIVMNPPDPLSRLEHILEDAEPRLILTDSANRPQAQKIAGNIQVVPIEPYLKDEPSSDPNLRIDPFDVAFLVYTSGSTGHPKGIMQSHRNILHNASRLSKGLQITGDDRVLMAASLSGAHGMATMACTLMNGAKLSLYPAMERGVNGLDDWMNQQQITLFVASASLFRYFAKTLEKTAFFPSVRMVRLGSESAITEDYCSLRQYFPDTTILFHTLSSSETGNITQARYRHGFQPTGDRLPVGYPAEGIEITLLDEDGVEVPRGETGEIVVRSRYLSPGYWRNPTLTESRFSIIDASANLRQYRTGDLGRLNPQGELIFLGRKDSQVKIHGYRVELSEVEDTIQELPEVNKAVVYAIPEKEGKRLVASIVLQNGRSITATDLRESLRQTLPNYMVPTSFTFLKDFPLTPHGKIDHQKLRQNHIVIVPSKGEVSSAISETEAVLIQIWNEALGVEHVARDSHFYDLGGDSLCAILIMARIEKQLHVELDLRVFLTYPKLFSLASEIDRMKEQRQGRLLTPLVRVSRESEIPLSYTQQRVWDLYYGIEGPTGYTVAYSYRLKGPLQVEAFKKSIQELHQRHEILRTTFALKKGEPVQIIHPHLPIHLRLIDYSQNTASAIEVLALLKKEALVSFDLIRGPLLRWYLVRISDNEHWLLRISHHIISDAWSWIIYFRDLAVLYEACINGESFPDFDSNTLQFADYAVWQRKVISQDNPKCAEAIEWAIRQFSGCTNPTVPPVKRWFKSSSAQPSEGTIRWGVDPDFSRELNRFGTAVGASYYVVRLAAFAVQLSRETHQKDIILGAYVTNRTRSETQNIIGFLSNQLPVRFPVDFSLTYREWINVVQNIVAETHAQGDIPCDYLREELAKRGEKLPEIGTIFSVTDNTKAIRFADLELSFEDRRIEVMPWGFSFIFNQHQETSACFVRFNAQIYQPRKVRRFLSRYIALIKALTDNPDTPMIKVLKNLRVDNRSEKLLNIIDDR